MRAGNQAPPPVSGTALTVDSALAAAEAVPIRGCGRRPEHSSLFPVVGPWAAAPSPKDVPSSDMEAATLGGWWDAKGLPPPGSDARP